MEGLGLSIYNDATAGAGVCVGWWGMMLPAGAGVCGVVVDDAPAGAGVCVGW